MKIWDRTHSLNAFNNSRLFRLAKKRSMNVTDWDMDPKLIFNSFAGREICEIELLRYWGSDGSWTNFCCIF